MSEHEVQHLMEKGLSTFILWGMAVNKPVCYFKNKTFGYTYIYISSR